MSCERSELFEHIESDLILREFFQEVTEYAIFLLDADGFVATWNEGARRIKGYERDEIIGRHLSVFYPTDGDGESPETVLSIAESEGSYEERGWRVRKDGSRILAHVIVRALSGDDGELRGFTKIVRDVTETYEYRQELERNRDRLERTEQLADIGGWEVDYETGELRLTDGTKRLVDIPSDAEVTLDGLGDFFHEDDRAVIDEAIESARVNGDPFDVEMRVVTATGRTRWVQVRGEPTDSGANVRGAVRDISDRKEREERLMVLNRVLRHNLRNNLNVVSGYASELKRDLEALDSPSIDEDDYERLHETLAKLSETTRGIDSELRTLDTLVAAASRFSTEAMVSKTDRIIENADSLVSTGEKARQFENAVEGSTDRHPVGVSDVFADLKRTYERKHPEAEVQIGPSEQTVLASTHSLYLALDELVQNAIVHNDRDRPVVAVWSRRLSGERVAIAVEDNGPGIPQTEREILKRGKETPLTHGSGMGLWTVHWFVTQFDGEVSILDRAEGGSTVELRLPAPEN
ncbi:PAS domain S-box protein [Haloferax sp. Atlit-10N]|uniref:histidine kinase n=2 Tax=Haloferax TaxID=2251 RepID=A0A871BLT3_HALGI|nr:MULTISPECIES: PAS domain S-box protein [Haloferax]QOS13653.1 sensor box histidine kinase [Haloferax gibbonsii]RDZ40129.1 PAS domain S-box protein [Haloferax sp. Atlit-19N]RDZ40200.1 PAS domain S-box protein [Haloferax sp. Atlit-16N]RDZ51132.1 PAS domain S-box protein [Haloferax sp. Atlit-4N]RDZ56872.1 PAS domain S-box protein [Haloferax sp. Atlit-10N]